jgi:hypothetical protein
MLEIKFYPESDKQEFIEAVKEYQGICDKEGPGIIKTIEKVSGLKFTEKFINAIVFDGISHSHPLRLRFSYPHEVKKATLIHELCHRLLEGNEIEMETNDPEIRSLELHKCLDLILYDIWEELYGEGFAKRNAKVECGRGPLYKNAWDWALSFDRKTRQAKFAGLVSPKTSN